MWKTNKLTVYFTHRFQRFIALRMRKTCAQVCVVCANKSKVSRCVHWEISQEMTIFNLEWVNVSLYDSPGGLDTRNTPFKAVLSQLGVIASAPSSASNTNLGLKAVSLVPFPLGFPGSFWRVHWISGSNTLRLTWFTDYCLTTDHKNKFTLWCPFRRRMESNTCTRPPPAFEDVFYWNSSSRKNRKDSGGRPKTIGVLWTSVFVVVPVKKYAKR